MIYCDDPAAFTPELTGQVEPEGVQELPAYWSGMVRRSSGFACTVPAPAPGWDHGLMVAAPQESQFDALRAATATMPLAHRVWCLAAAGQGCRGQHGRQWLALAGNLHLSVGLPAPVKVAALGPVLNALPVVVAADAVGRLLPRGPAPRIKWVNDLLLDGAKVGGMLTAVRRREGGDEVFLGMGLNVASAPVLIPDRFTRRATSLAELDSCPPALSLVLATVLEALSRRWVELDTTGPGPMLHAYRAACIGSGQSVEVWPDDAREDAGSPTTGTMVGVDDDLGLVLDDGRTLRAGRLVPLDR